MLHRIDNRRFISGIWTAASTLPYTAVLFILELIRPGQWVFLRGSQLRDPFLVISVISWPFMVTGAAICIVLAISTRRLSSHDFNRYILACAAFAFLSLAGGTLLTVAAAVIVFIAFKNKWEARHPGSALRWIVPIFMGIVPAIFYALWSFSNMRAFVSALYRLAQLCDRRGRRDGRRREQTGESRNIEDGYAALNRGEHDEEIAKTTFDEKLLRLQELGFTDRLAAMHALQVSDYSVDRAVRKLRSEARG